MKIQVLSALHVGGNTLQASVYIAYSAGLVSVSIHADIV